MATDDLHTEDETPRVLLVITTRHFRYLRHVLLVGVVVGLSGFVLRTYRRLDDPHYGWSKLIGFGSMFEDQALPRLRRTRHYVDPHSEARGGYDGQFYAQIAFDPSLRDPAFDKALDLPAYRARRIGLPALSFLLGAGKPRQIIQVYALGNLLFWFVLLGALLVLLKPCREKQLLCLSAALLSSGVIVSLELALVDLPATALIFAGAAIGSLGGAVLAVAALTRETSILALGGYVDLRWPRDAAQWRRDLSRLALALVPLIVWMFYVRLRFPGGSGAGGDGNWAFPLQAMAARFGSGVHGLVSGGPGLGDSMGWPNRFYADDQVHGLLVILSLFCQGLFLLLRRDRADRFWRMGICYVVLGAVLGPAVWEGPDAAARVLLPMTICFYLRLARERGGWFWAFFVAGSLSVPYGVHDFFLLS